MFHERLYAIEKKWSKKRKLLHVKRKFNFDKFLKNSLFFSVKGKQRSSNEVQIPKIETLANRQLEQPTYHPHHSSTRVYATGSTGIDESDLQYEGIDTSAIMNDELSMLSESQPYSSQQSAPSSQQQNYGFQHSAELSLPLKQNLRNLKNVLKLPKARRFALFFFGNFIIPF